MKKIIAAAIICFAVPGTLGLVMAGPIQDDLVMELKNLVERQQKQLDTQASEIAKLKEQMAELTGTQEVVSEKLAAVETEGKKVSVSSGNKHAEVQLYGHVNRAVLWADDGNSSKTYFVDNTNSMTRLGIKGKIQATDDDFVRDATQFIIDKPGYLSFILIFKNRASAINHNAARFQ